MPAANKTFRIFISSPFSDLKAERNALQAEVFPELRAFCAEHGARFQAIDLRWGISQEASRDQQTVRICLDEIARCQAITPRPNFLVLLGDRYGWCPPPAEIPQDEWDTLKPVIPAEDIPLVETWYRQDDNADPVAYVLQPWDGLTYDAWGKVEAELQRILARAAGEAGLPEAARFKYWASATHQEIAAGAFSDQAEPDHVFAFFRNIKHPPKGPEGGTFFDLVSTADGKVIDTKARDRQQQIKTELENTLGGDNTRQYTAQWADGQPTYDHLPELCQDVLHLLKAAIHRQIEAQEKVDPLAEELAEQNAFVNQHTRFFTGRDPDLAWIAKCLTGENNHPLVIWGDSGTGKSALMAAALRQAQAAHPEASLIFRFIGATPESANGQTLLGGLTQELAQKASMSPEIPEDFSGVVTAFQKQLYRAGPTTPLILFIDGINQLSEADPARELTWLPRMLPTGVRIVVTTKPGPILDSLLEWLPQENFHHLQPLPESDASDLLATWLAKDAHRKLQRHQRQDVLKNTHPLYLKLAYQEAKRWHSYDSLPKGADEAPGLSDTVAGVVNDFLHRLSKDDQHGPILVRQSLGYLSGARHGLTEDEILDLLSTDREVYTWFLKSLFHIPPDLLEATQTRTGMDPASAEVWLQTLIKNEADLEAYLEELWEDEIQLRLPVVLWSRLYADLAPYLLAVNDAGDRLIRFYHDEVREVASELAGDAQNNQAFHTPMADYFGKLSRYNHRRLDEQPYQLAAAGSWKSLSQLLSEDAMFNTLWERKPFDLRRYWTQIEAACNLRIEAVYQDWINHPQEVTAYTLLNLIRLMRELDRLHKHLPLLQYLIQYFKDHQDLGHYQVAVSYLGALQQMQGNLSEALAGFKAQEALARQSGKLGALSEAIGNQAVIHQMQGGLDQAEKLLAEQLDLCRQTGDQKGLVTALGNLALNHRMQGQLQDALNLHKQEEKLCREIGDQDGLMRTTLNQAGIYAARAEIKKALSLLDESEALARQYGNRDALQKALGQKGEIYIHLNQLDKAMQHCQEQEHICRELGNNQDLIAALGNQSAVYLTRRELDRALPLITECEQLCREMGSLRQLTTTLSNKAAILGEKGRFEEALMVYEDMEKVCKQIGQIDNLALCLTNQAVTIYQGRLGSPAIIHQKLAQALELAQSHGFTRLATQITALMGRIFQ